MRGGLDLGKISHGLAAWGALLGTATLLQVVSAAATGGASVPLQLACQVFGSAAEAIAGNMAAGHLQDHVAARITDPEAVLRNHDLQKLVGDSIRLTLTAFADRETGHGSAVRDALRRIADRTAELWPRVRETPGIARLNAGDVKPLVERELPTLVARLAGSDAPVQVLDAAEWRRLLAHGASWARVPDEGAVAAALDDAAADLRDRFAVTFRELLKRDAEQDGKAYAGMQLLVHGELLTLAREAKASNSRVEQAIAALAGSVARSASAEALARHESILKGLQAALASVDDGLDACREDIRRLRNITQTGFDAVLADLAGLAAALRAVAAPVAVRLAFKDFDADVGRHPTNWARLLRPEYELCAFFGREKESDSLCEWLGDPVPVGIHTVAGGAGTGKTRLARQIVRKAREAGWDAGFAGMEALRQFVARPMTEWSWRRPTLVVLDYASRHADEIDKLLRSLFESRGSHRDAARLRLLLLDRQAGGDLPWWKRVFGHGGGDYQDWLDGCSSSGEVTTLRTLDGGADETPGKIVASVLEALAARGALPRGAPPHAATVLTQIQAMRLEATPLVLQLAAVFLRFVPPGVGEGVSPERRTLAVRDALLREYWRHETEAHLRSLSIGNCDPIVIAPIVRRIVAAAILLRGAPWPAAGFRRDVETWANDLGMGPSDLPGAVSLRAALRDFLGGTDDRLGTIQPDLLAEYWLLREFQDALVDDASRAAFVAGRLARSPIGASVTLVRLAQDFPHEHATWRFLESAVRDRDVWTDASVERALAAFPDETVELRDLGDALTDRALSALRSKTPTDETGSVQHLDALGRALGARSIALSRLGRREEALSAAQAAVKYRQTLASSRPDDFLPGVASCLNNLGVFHSELGRREEALSAVGEATGLYRTLASLRPDAFLPDLASSLNNLGNSLFALGRLEAALSAAVEAETIRRKLASSRPDAFLPDLAMSLSNLGAILFALGQREKALSAAEESMGLYRKLASSRPDAFLPDLAMSLNNLGTFLSELGRREAALSAVEEAVRISRTLALSRPGAFHPDLAASLNNLGSHLAALGRREVALSAAEEASGIYRTLASLQPDAFLPDLASSLNNLGNRLAVLGRWEAALSAVEEAVTIRRTLETSWRDASLPDLAMSLNNLGNVLAGLGRAEAALSAAEEATGIYRALSSSRPDAYLPDLATGLNNLGIRLSALGRREAALSAAEEATRIYRTLSSSRPDAFLPDLARSLAVTAMIRLELDRPSDALDAARESVRSITPAACRHGAPMRGLTRFVVSIFLQTARAAGAARDMELLEPLLPLLVDDDDAGSGATAPDPT